MYGNNISELLKKGRTKAAIGRKARALGIECYGGIEKQCLFCNKSFKAGKFHPYRKYCDTCLREEKYKNYH
jgi:hypothetical protein